MASNSFYQNNNNTDNGNHNKRVGCLSTAGASIFAIVILALMGSEGIPIVIGIVGALFIYVCVYICIRVVKAHHSDDE
ncbi:hypothetical protein [Acetilactobacillus jinshanensis]|uniref:Uncharacterized protein n=1 Tax=Acetilactobacillus jinshanensis TaxID=1720083 RepID=A0A4P6ZLL3_9LACO|nr:hypothetical protein [Acetilactobacillus jinshanensis]QBP18473.1 hypothetical protein ELX58_04840 [Acetilactobacillus jinshanensis]URL61344.1 hypothetical protein HGK75_04955 [uncultured bacterium]